MSCWGFDNQDNTNNSQSIARATYSIIHEWLPVDQVSWLTLSYCQDHRVCLWHCVSHFCQYIDDIVDWSVENISGNYSMWDLVTVSEGLKLAAAWSLEPLSRKLWRIYSTYQHRPQQTERKSEKQQQNEPLENQKEKAEERKSQAPERDERKLQLAGYLELFQDLQSVCSVIVPSFAKGILKKGLERGLTQGGIGSNMLSQVIELALEECQRLIDESLALYRPSDQQVSEWQSFVQATELDIFTALILPLDTSDIELPVGFPRNFQSIRHQHTRACVEEYFPFHIFTPIFDHDNQTVSGKKSGGGDCDDKNNSDDDNQMGNNSNSNNNNNDYTDSSPISVQRLIHHAFEPLRLIRENDSYSILTDSQNFRKIWNLTDENDLKQVQQDLNFDTQALMIDMLNGLTEEMFIKRFLSVLVRSLIEPNNFNPGQEFLQSAILSIDV